MSNENCLKPRNMSLIKFIKLYGHNAEAWRDLLFSIFHSLGFFVRNVDQSIISIRIFFIIFNVKIASTRSIYYFSR